ncbi:embigin [Betta splendens]|uniref:Embigin n=1 Tax=Betta splendens TaxID=158456 RepID=A0A6P7NJL6_BETSP|nr:embigin [Betta splendens]
MIMSASWNQLFFQTTLLLVSCRHISTKTPGPTPAPLLPIGPLTNLVKTVEVRANESHTVELLERASVELVCKWAGNENKPQNVTGYWTKDGSEIKNSSVTVQLEKEQYVLKQMFTVLNETDLGNYSCVFGNEAKAEFILAVPQIGEKRDKPIIGYANDFMVIQCKIDDTKPVPTSWKWARMNGTEKEPIVAAAESRRYKIEIEERKTKLFFHKMTKADAGLYSCGAVYAIGTAYSQVELKIITFWEPLKLFIGILVEVIILVAAILIYERSQSGKQCTKENGPNPDQRNSMTQEENNDEEGGSAVRQRKV